MTVNVKHSKPCKYFKSVSEDLQTVDANVQSTERPSERELGLSSLNNETACSLCEKCWKSTECLRYEFLCTLFLLELQALDIRVKQKGMEHLLLRENKGVRENNDSTEGKLKRW